MTFVSYFIALPNAYAKDTALVKEEGKEREGLLPLKEKRKLYSDSEVSVSKYKMIEELKKQVNSEYRAKKAEK